MVIQRTKYLTSATMQRSIISINFYTLPFFLVCIPCHSSLANTLMALFYDHAYSADLIRHSMNLVKRTVDILNTEQVPIIIVDQALFTIAKANPVKLDSKSRRRLVHCVVWRPSHRDGSFQDYRQSSRQQWVDRCISSSQCWYGRFISLHLLCDPHPTSPPDHSKQLVFSCAKS